MGEARKPSEAAISGAGDEVLIAAYAIIDGTADMNETVTALRDLLRVSHLVYHSSKLGASPSADPYIRLTYPDAWIRRYLQMGYIDVDPVIREGFLRALPFDWRELKIETAAEMAFLHDAFAHNVGPFGYSVPVRSKNGHRALFSISCAISEDGWNEFLKSTQSTLIEIANRLHRRVIAEELGESDIHLSTRELECLRWVGLGKSASEIAAILNISAHTARDYLKSARFKLDCVSSAQAVTKAVKLGLIVL
jgi:DNA-binding CsgD family transcriptional regulator